MEKATQSKVRFKLYKAGKKWLVGASIAIAVGIGNQLVATPVSANSSIYSYSIGQNVTVNGIDGKLAAQSYAATAQ